MSDDLNTAYVLAVELALRHYHRHYDNAEFKALQSALVSDTCGAYQASEPALLERALCLPELYALGNGVTDVALQICGHPNVQGRDVTLMRNLCEARVSAETVRLISQYFERFEGEGSVFSADFEHATLALLYLNDLSLPKIGEHTNLIHSWCGNLADDALWAMDALAATAQALLLGETDVSYLGEKLRVVQVRLSRLQAGLAKF